MHEKRGVFVSKTSVEKNDRKLCKNHKNDFAKPKNEKWKQFPCCFKRVNKNYSVDGGL